MTAKTAQQLFGATAVLTNTTLTVNLSDFATVGLSDTTPSAQQVFSSIILRASSNYVEADDDDIEVGVTCKSSTGKFFARSDGFVGHPYEVVMFTPNSVLTVDPDVIV